MHELGTTAAVTRTVDLWERRPAERDSAFEDWTIDGVPLRRLVADRWGVPDLPSELTRLWPEAPRAAVAGLRALLGDGTPDFGDGRVALLVCAVDQDINCRALAASLVIEIDAVHWRDVGWQVDFEEFVPAPDEYGPLSTYSFDRRQYEGLLGELLRRYEALAAATPAEPPVRQRRRRAPWSR
ncbi:hypothetical protein GCU60_11705 [Blastococcus saxobsidens]|uniref:Uncharacterized protein n=1 Tax=Blastococcus saxobsidens TaxID=138336 RepID=A0A6L9W2U1_9ACTN|nr:hypothetical protein [Blastococcus saxobsidens]NEK86416.1 hypothetical protein [Blastococcus saxobsidens]